MNLQKLLAELDKIYERDPHGQWSGNRAAAIVNEVSEAMAKAGHAELVRAPVPDCDVVAVKRYLAACIAATKEPIETPPANGPLSVVQAAKELGVSKETVYKLCAEGDLSHVRIANRITITREQLEQYREEQER
jgi:excisionase family DNA binding protein